MIYLIHGSDTAKARAKWRAAASTLAAKRPGVSVFRLYGEELSLERLEELLVGQTLFDQKFIVLLDGVWEARGASEILENNLGLMVESGHVFLWLEEKLTAAILKKLEKLGAKTEEFKLKKVENKKEGMELFALVDAFAARRRKDAWLMYIRAREGGTAAEEVFWKLVWKIKTLLLVEMANNNYSSLGLKPYPLAQAKTQIKNYAPGELATLSTRLVETYHRARRGQTDLGLALERLILDK